ncbi:MAG: Z1 domain-containing protein [Candidatus Omnitrophota bacterium]|nr:Z1 domain-containing protein [Candidatus Omnitrophota bacterium]
MLNLQGQNFKEALDAIEPKLNEAGREEARKNAAQIVSAVVKTYEEKIKVGEVGKDGNWPSGELSLTVGSSPTGLVYGRIQSGKTRAMITSAALAFDNKFQIIVVVTSNNNRLVDQTHRDFQNGLPGSIRVYSKAHFRQEVEQAKQILTSGNGGIVIICSKGTTRLNQAIEFLRNIDAKEYSAIIFDDEGDQATLDTNTLRRSTRNPLIPPSRIHQLIHDPAIHSLREALPRHVFVSVTGTPSGIVLQNIDNKSRPSFIELLEPGKDYVGGEIFFSTVVPATNKLVSLINENERIELFGGNQGVPDGLKKSIRFFLLAAVAASDKLKWPDDGAGYKLLCHPSVKTSDQEKVAGLVRKYLVELTGAFTNAQHHLYNDLRASYDSLKQQTPGIPSFESLLATISRNFNSREVLLLNKNTTSDELNYSKYFNFLIGGNILGRGLAIKNLLVTYYVREAKVTQMDTMYQHARMFGYRKITLPYTRVFLPPQLYERFRQIFISDEDLRKFIEKHKGSPESFPVRIAKDIRATRKCVLDARNVDILIPGKQIYPNYPFSKAPTAGTITAKVHKKLEALFPEYKTKGREGKKISTDEAKKLLSLIKTNGTNVWNDKKILIILSYLSQQFNDGVILKYRKANRAAGDEKGLLYQGVLFGGVVTQDASGNRPVLWLFDMKFVGGTTVTDWDGREFIYPTLVLPEKAHSVVFNKS